MDRSGGRGRITRGMIPILAIQVASELYRLRRKPPVTAGLILANTLIYLRPGALHRLLPSIDEVWFNPHLIVKVLLRFHLLLLSAPILMNTISYISHMKVSSEASIKIVNNGTPKPRNIRIYQCVLGFRIVIRSKIISSTNVEINGS
ncbi:hypothetical protein KSP39_PZI004668 [Platanthera zijinensis]|uniref:Uncharacterized protein n=1 Tax=Platanthera zijinensis TaxID=2320716 RepID=A0AAP0BXY4_9ASPA